MCAVPVLQQMPAVLGHVVAPLDGAPMGTRLVIVVLMLLQRLDTDELLNALAALEANAAAFISEKEVI